jgi:hypothetical protein
LRTAQLYVRFHRHRDWLRANLKDDEMTVGAAMRALAALAGKPKPDLDKPGRPGRNFLRFEVREVEVRSLRRLVGADRVNVVEIGREVKQIRLSDLPPGPLLIVRRGEVGEGE